ncbi:conserved hypothetical protein [Coccidioides posadasii str. Silveira]|uniref:Uncharacterized protein n=1 Tax=Coccidioides posadasii (strain RMSCC 757 / Silveira) TaxID=443226 RepID=E9DAD4_COCPS|nr:conserved hypothetical protein [Coccidioides posadasii str. Silveira]
MQSIPQRAATGCYLDSGFSPSLFALFEVVAHNHQILNGLSYLIAQHFKHESLNCLNILMGLDGRIQIGIYSSLMKKPQLKPTSKSKRRMSLLWLESPWNLCKNIAKIIVRLELRILTVGSISLSILKILSHFLFSPF